MMHATFFILYFLAFCFAITRMHFFKTGIKPAWVIILFGMHVAAGCIHNWIAYKFYPNHGDIWYYFEESIALKAELLNHPMQFLSGIFSLGWNNITDTSKPILDIQYQALQRVNAALNIFSFNNFYINTLLFSFPVFAGMIALFKTFKHVFNNRLVSFTTLVLPSVLFWTAVIHKDSIFYMAIGFFFYYLVKPSNNKWLQLLLLTFFTGLMFLSRTNALITLLPAVFFFLLTEKFTFHKKTSLIVTFLAIITTIIIFNSFVKGGILHGISERQKDFQSMAGGSRMYLPVIEPSAGSFVHVFPFAVFNGFFQPLPGTGGKLIYTLFSIELMAIWILVITCIVIWIRKKINLFNNFGITCLLFAIPGLIIIGYMIPFAGAIIRYRSIYLPFILAPFLNALSNYPASAFKKIDEWICRNIMIAEAKAEPA